MSTGKHVVEVTDQNLEAALKTCLAGRDVGMEALKNKDTGKFRDDTFAQLAGQQRGIS